LLIIAALPTKISGRGLGITDGTLDKIESIPGFNVNLDERRALKQLQRIGVFMIGQTADICPADKKLYALRDFTGPCLRNRSLSRAS
jgi:pyrimidine-nucleoside phosphorylase